jgi:hypothetical protein
MSVDPITPQPQVIIVPPNGGGGGGLATRLGGAILASCLISFIGYFATYTTVAARFWLRKEGATIVEMPAETKGKKPSMVERSRGVLGDTIGKIKEQLAKTKESTTGGIEKAKESVTGGMAKATKKGAQIGKAIGHKVDTKAEELKHMLAMRQEESRKKHEEEAKQLAIDRAKYDEWVEKYLEHYDGQCPNPRCRAPLRTKGNSASKYVGCARCQFRFMAGRARALGPPKPPPFRSGNQSILGKLFKL